MLQDGHRRWEPLIEKTSLRGAPRLLNFGSTALALDAAIDGHGVAIAPSFLVEHEIKIGRLTEIWAMPDASGEFMFMSWVKHDSDFKPLRQTVNWLLSEFRADVSS